MLVSHGHAPSLIYHVVVAGERSVYKASVEPGWGRRGRSPPREQGQSLHEAGGCYFVTMPPHSSAAGIFFALSFACGKRPSARRGFVAFILFLKPFAEDEEYQIAQRPLFRIGVSAQFLFHFRIKPNVDLVCALCHAIIILPYIAISTIIS